MSGVSEGKRYETTISGGRYCYRLFQVMATKEVSPETGRGRLSESFKQKRIDLTAEIILGSPYHYTSFVIRDG